MKKLVLLLTVLLIGQAARAVDPMDVIDDIAYVVNAIERAIPVLTESLQKAQITALVKNLNKWKNFNQAGCLANGKTAEVCKKERALLAQQAIADLATIPQVVSNLFRFETAADGTVKKGLVSDLVDKFGAGDVALALAKIGTIIDGLAKILGNYANVTPVKN